jgi:hypothetical protein
LNRGNNANDGVPVSWIPILIAWIMSSNGATLEHVCPVTVQLPALWNCKLLPLLKLLQW